MAILRLAVRWGRGQLSWLPCLADPPERASGKISILVVDDDIGTCQTLFDILEAKGYQVDTAEDGFQAIEKVRGTNFDVIILDIRMPRMNGVESYRKIKKITPKVKAIMITAYAVEDLIGEAYKEGVIKVMRKPLEIESLIESIKAAMVEADYS